MELTNENYYSREANREYMNFSQYRDFLNCEAMAMAKLFDGWEEPRNENFLVGSYVHAWNEGKLDEFLQSTPELFTKKGELYSHIKFADEMIGVLAADEFITRMLQGRKEFVVTAEFAGSMWKCRLDVYHPESGYFTEIKTVRSLSEKVWSRERKMYLSFLEAYGYLTQVSVYAEVERRFAERESWLQPVMVAVTKENPPDKAVISFDEDRIRYEVSQIEYNMPRIMRVKAGQEKPERCEACRYCRHTKKITGMIHYSEL